MYCMFVNHSCVILILFILQHISVSTIILFTIAQSSDELEFWCVPFYQQTNNKSSNTEHLEWPMLFKIHETESHLM